MNLQTVFLIGGGIFSLFTLYVSNRSVIEGLILGILPLSYWVSGHIDLTEHRIYTVFVACFASAVILVLRHNFQMRAMGYVTENNSGKREGEPKQF